MSNETHKSGNGGSGADPSLRMSSLSPEEAERFAALFVPTWELPLDAAAAPNDKASGKPFDAKSTMMGISAPLQPQQPVQPEKTPSPKATMMGIAAPVAMTPAPIAAPVRAPENPSPIPDAKAQQPPKTPIELAVAPAAPIIRRPAPTPSVDASDAYPATKRSPIIYAVAAGVVAVCGIVVFVATRSGDKDIPKDDKKETVTEKKKLDLPEPVAPEATTAAAKPTETTKPAETKPTPAETAKAAPPPPEETAKAAPPPPPPPKATAAPPPPPPPKATAAPPPPPKATAAPPKATAAPPPKAKPKIKDEF